MLRLEVDSFGRVRELDADVFGGTIGKQIEKLAFDVG